MYNANWTLTTLQSQCNVYREQHHKVPHATYSKGRQDYTRKGGLSSLPVHRGRLNMDGAATSCIRSLAGLG